MQRNFLHHFPPIATRTYTLLTSTFSHQTLPHFFFNSVALISFGSGVHDRLGSEQFLAVFVAGGLASSVVSHLARVKRRPGGASLGSSGAVYAVFAMMAYFEPQAKAQFIFLPGVPIALETLFPCLVLLDVVGVLSKWRILDHWGHLGGALFGYVYARYGQTAVWGHVPHSQEGLHLQTEHKELNVRWVQTPLVSGAAMAASAFISTQSPQSMHPAIQADAELWASPDPTRVMEHDHSEMRQLRHQNHHLKQQLEQQREQLEQHRDITIKTRDSMDASDTSSHEKLTAAARQRRKAEKSRLSNLPIDMYPATVKELMVPGRDEPVWTTWLGQYPTLNAYKQLQWLYADWVDGIHVKTAVASSEQRVAPLRLLEHQLRTKTHVAPWRSGNKMAKAVAERKVLVYAILRRLPDPAALVPSTDSAVVLRLPSFQ
ncbi:hypothetical protein WJX79_010756 [Trebouxia sp. C0005]